MPQERRHGAEHQAAGPALRRAAPIPARHEAPSVARVLGLQRQAGNAAVSGLVQRLPVSLKGMANCGFVPHRGDEWIWWNRPGKEPNHVSAIRTGDDVHQFHAKSEYKGGRTNRIDWQDNGSGDFEGPVTKKQEASETWDGWFPAAEAAGNTTARLLKQNKKTT
jgi:hypothetical protein